MDRILNYINAGIAGGAKLVAGGKRKGSVGYFIEPTVFADVTDEMVIAKEEVSDSIYIKILLYRYWQLRIESNKQLLSIGFWANFHSLMSQAENIFGTSEI